MCSEVLPEFSLYHGTYHKMPIVGKHLITHWIWGYHGKPRAQPASCRCLHFLVHNLLERSVLGQSIHVGVCWCLAVWGLSELSHLRSDSQLSGYRGKLWQFYVGWANSCWADFPDESNGKLLKLSKGRAEGQPWICFFDLGLGGEGRRNKCGIAFGPSLTMTMHWRIMRSNDIIHIMLKLTS